MYEWGDDRRFNSYSRYFKDYFGGRVQKLSVNAGFSCPNRDGNLAVGGCTFCNNEAFSPSYCQPQKSVETQLREGITFHKNRYRHADKYLAYFQSYSNTYAPIARLREIYTRTLDVEGVVGIVVGTRPDCVDEQKLDFFAALAKDRFVAIEYGIESCYDQTLERVNRGHDFAVARRAVEMTAERGLKTGAHFILGLPGESREMMLNQTDRINALPLHTVKFHQLQIFKGTAMETDYAAHPDQYRFWERDEYIDFFIDILERLRPDLVVERFASEAPPQFHAGPTWGHIRNEQLLQIFERRLKERDTWQGRLYDSSVK